MRAVLGILFLMGGFAVAYVVLSGKLPTGSTTSPTASGTSSLPTAQSLQQTQAQMTNKNGSGGPTNDMTASRGGFS